MLSQDRRAAYQRLLVFGLLSACLVVFISSDKIESVHAAPCIQECEADEAMCYDSCAYDCSNNGDATCHSCISDCVAEFNSCAEHAVWCGSGGASYSPNCQLEYSNHCPIPNDPTCTGGHSGYYLICNTLGGNHCVACPDDNWVCTGSNGYGSCY
jgi:hypothetical protein